MKLNAFERLHILRILPQEGDFLLLKILRDLQSKVGFNEKELKALPELVDWNKEENKDRVLKETEIDFSETEKEIVRSQLVSLDKKKMLRREYFSIYEKFVQDENREDKKK